MAAADAGYFSIDKATGQLKVKETLDYDMNPMGGPPDGKYKFYGRGDRPQRRDGGSGSDRHRRRRQRHPGDNGEPLL